MPNRFSRKTPSITALVLFLVAFVCLPLFRLLVRCVSFERIIAILRLKKGGSESNFQPVALNLINKTRARDCATAVRRACRYLPGEYLCLPQALTGKFMLTLYSTPCTICLGVMIQEHKKLKAHAWLVHANIIIIGVEHTHGLTKIATYS